MTTKVRQGAFERHPIITSASLLIVLPILVLLGAEFVLRFTDARSLLGNPMWFPQGMVRMDSELAYDLSPNFDPAMHVFPDSDYREFSNDFGCFDRPFDTGEPYVLLLGDSFTWGYAPFESKLGTVMEESIGKRVYKCGVPGFGVLQAARKGRRVIDKLGRAPETIVYGYFTNDLEDDYFFPKETVVNGHLVSTLVPCADESPCEERFEHQTLEQRYESMVLYGRPDGSELTQLQRVVQRAKQLLKEHSIIARLIRRVMNRPLIYQAGTALVGQDPEESPKAQAAWRTHEAALPSLQELSRDVGAELVVVMIPERQHVYQVPEEAAKLAELRYQRSEALLKKLAIPHLSLLGPFQEYVAARTEGGPDGGAGLYWRNDIHWNETGNRVAGHVVAQYLLGRWAEESVGGEALPSDNGFAPNMNAAVKWGLEDVPEGRAN